MKAPGTSRPAPPHWPKGPGVSAGRNRLTGACPTVVRIYLRKVDAARSIGCEMPQIPAANGCFRSRGRNCRAKPAVAEVRKLSSLRYHIRRPKRRSRTRARAQFVRIFGFAKALRSWYIGRSARGKANNAGKTNHTWSKRITLVKTDYARETDQRKLRNQSCP